MIQEELDAINSAMIDTVVHLSDDGSLDTGNSTFKGTTLTVCYYDEGVSI